MYLFEITKTKSLYVRFKRCDIVSDSNVLSTFDFEILPSWFAQGAHEWKYWGVVDGVRREGGIYDVTVVTTRPAPPTPSALLL